MMRPTPKPGVMDAPLYVPGDHKLEGIDEPAILSANENPLGPSPNAIAAFRDGAEKLHRYPDGGANELRRAIGEMNGLDPDRIICGAGSDELITLLIRAYAGVGDEVVYSKHGFAMYRITAITTGATPVAAPEKNLTTDVDAMLAAVGPQTKLVFIANPNNPTGTYLADSEVRRLIEGLPSHVLCVLDAAYAEYVSRNDYSAGASFVDDYDNVVMLRTFSKIYGLAALRLGWGYARRDVIDAMNRLRSPFNVNSVAQAAGVAAIRDTAHVRESCRHNDEWLVWLTEQIKALGLEVNPSVGNFILIGFGDADRCKRANAFLEKQGVIARGVGGYHLPEYLRLTVGTEKECRQSVDALKGFLAAE